jgi:hypothetical protein
MRRFDKIKNIRKANLLVEQRYLESKVLIKENNNMDISLLKTLVAKYPNLVRYFENSSTGYRYVFKINADETLVNKKGNLLPHYIIGIGTAYSDEPIENHQWIITKYTYTPTGRRKQVDFGVYDSHEVKKVYSTMNRIIKFLLRESS